MPRPHWGAGEVADGGGGLMPAMRWAARAAAAAAAAQELIKEREEPELAWVFYATLTRQHNEAVRALKRR